MMGLPSLNRRIQSSSLIVVLLAAAILQPMVVDKSNQKKVHLLTIVLAEFIFLAGVFLFLVVFSNQQHPPGRCRYMAIKILLHALSILLACLSFSISLMMRMNIFATSSTLALAAMYVGHRLWQSKATTLRADLAVYRGCEEEVHQLLETSSGVASILLSGWFNMASYCFQNYPEEVGAARFLPSEYLLFSTSVAASLMLVKAVPRRHPPIPPPASLMLVVRAVPRPVRELRALVCLLVAAVVATALAIAASKVGRHRAALALALGCAQWAKDKLGLPIPLPAWLQEGHGGGDQGEGEPPAHSFLTASVSLLLAVLTYHVKDAGALSTPYAKISVGIATAAVVAALGWRFLSLLMMPPGVQAAKKVLAHSTILLLLLLGVLALPGAMRGW